LLHRLSSVRLRLLPLTLADQMSHSNDELSNRIAMAEDELQNAMRNRNTSSFESEELTTADFGHDDTRSRERWRHELEARSSETDQQTYATSTELWNQGSPDAAVKGQTQWGDAEVFAEAVMHHVPEGGQFMDCLEHCLNGTPYQVFAEWYVNSVEYDPNGPLDSHAVCEAARAFLTASETLSATAVNVGASPHRQYVEGAPSIPNPTPGLSRSNVASRSHDLIDYIQTKPAITPRPMKAPRVLVHVTVEIGDGRSGTIDVHEGDTPEELAAAFVQMHGLSNNVIEPLAAHVENSIEAVIPKLHSPKKKATSEPAHPDRASPRTLQRPQSTPGWVARMNKPLKGPRACMDPSRKMVASPRGLYEDAEDEAWALSPRVTSLGMTPQAATATQVYLDSREQHTGLDERGAQLSARMRSKSKASMAVSARLYKDAAQREQKLKLKQAKNENEKKFKLEAEAKAERRKWGGSPNKAAPQPRFVMVGDQQTRVGVHQALYEDHAKRQQKQNADVDKHCKEMAKKEAAVLERSKLECWGKPRISKKARECAREGSEVWERICDWDGAERKEKVEKIKKEHVNAEMDACTFDIAASIATNPETGNGKRSTKLVNNMVSQAGHDSASNRFEALYQDAQQRQLRVEQYQNWYPEDQTFNPDIGPDRYKPRVDETDEEFVNRLTYYKQDKLLAAEQGPRMIDQNTGQKMFEPQTGRGPMTERNPSGLPIGDYLHACSYDIAEMKAEREEQRETLVASLATQSKTTTNSHSIMENVRQQQLFEIFSAIDTDGDGIIDPSAAAEAAHSRLPAEIANDICPLVIHSGQQHDFRSFYALCRDQVSSAQVGPKGYLVPERERHMRSLDEYMISKDASTHRKSLSQRSSALAQQRREHRSGSLYESLTEEREIWDERRRNMSEKKAAEELSACTFQPNVERVGARVKMSGEVAQRLVKPAQPTRAY